MTRAARRAARITIDSGWVTEILKRGAPAAFVAKLAAVPGTVFIDGQIMLMKGEHVKTWKQYVDRPLLPDGRAHGGAGLRQLRARAVRGCGRAPA